MAKITKDQVKELFLSVHGYKYDYLGCEGDAGTNYAINAVCAIHGVFSRTYNSVRSKGRGCPACGKGRTFTKESFALECNYVHKGKFDYGKTEYVDAHSKVTVTCKDHEDFDVKAYVHLAGHDCPQCAKENHVGYYDLEKLTNKQRQRECVLYHVRFTKFDGSQFDKIGVSVNGWFRRFNKHRSYFKSIDLVRECNDTLENCLLMEQLIMDSIKEDGRAYKVHDLKNMNLGGWTECFLPINHTTHQPRHLATHAIIVTIMPKIRGLYYGTHLFHQRHARHRP